MSEYSKEELKTMVIDDLKKRIDKLEDSQKEIVKISTIMEVMQGNSTKRDTVLAQQSETLAKINENLNLMSHSITGFDKRLGSLEENFYKREENSTIDIVQTFKQVITYVLVSGLGGAIVFALLNLN